MNKIGNKLTKGDTNVKLFFWDIRSVQNRVERP
jgi:hypothetical protein